MNILILTKVPLEGQGLKWIITSQLRDIHVDVVDDVQQFEIHIKDQASDYLIVDLDLWGSQERSFLPQQVQWLGISSERTFQTAYRALTHKAEDVLFRPFQPEHLVKHVQQARFRLRNEKKGSQQLDSVQQTILTYEDLLLAETYPSYQLLMSAIVPSDREQGSRLVRALEDFTFPTSFNVFPFSEFVLVVHRLGETDDLLDAYRAFFALWNRQSDTLLSIYLYESTDRKSARTMYQKMRRFQKRIFYDGYDILSVELTDLIWREIDPFLSPLEQRTWIEMLEKQDVKAIRNWLEQDFLTIEKPYPDPQMVRIRLTSVLAQMRRYMIAKSFQNGPIEKQYHLLFQDIISEPVMYHIIQMLGDFTSKLMKETSFHVEGISNFSEKIRMMMESNYWDSTWNLATCAETLRMNKSTLSRKYSQSSGKKFRETLQEIRIREAKRLLKETQASFEEISRLTGYTHQTYFNAKFKSATGQTPSDYRFN
ncbi:helix-turn-helix transcriptional regulator [Paenisporosarcina sp. TG20]|uniref:helix-turn-helix transcriptional regulator n=1 Tax=Paenisporosarcina sp. TG20 TaxID=1211706 RepID=UPI0002FE421B|nr:response regulator transcription factor [Paenisporosarcina sp. TG20]